MRRTQRIGMAAPSQKIKDDKTKPISRPGPP
jgi:hypothetical protein